VTVTDICQSLGWPECSRRFDVGPERADAEILINDNIYWLEWDSGCEDRKQWLHRISHYRGDHTILVVTQNADRLKDLMEWSGRLGDGGYFTTLDAALADPYECIWRSLNGSVETLEKPSENDVA
jgi:hypothetical protein